MNSIRIKTYFIVIPIAIATVVTSGYLTFMESQTALTRIANRHLAYKAEQLRDYINSEWDVVRSLGLSDREEYRDAQEKSFRSYAYSLLRSDTEQVLALDSGKAVRFSIGGGAAPPGPESAGIADIPLGWFSQELFGRDRVGIAFEFEPFGWTIAITELRSQYFSDVDGILRKNLVILAVSLVLSILVTTLYLRYIIGPLERLNSAIALIAETRDLSLRAPVEYQDEIGALARSFNGMVQSLETQNLMLMKANQSEREAREKATRHEIETLFLLGRVSDYNDEDTGTHLQRIGTLSSLFVRLLGLGDEQEELMRSSAPLHDIGKIAIPQAILQKPGGLSIEEREIMQRHAELGYDLLKDSKSRFLAEAAIIARTHHENWDGSGYPRGLAGDSIPLSGRIVSIVDVFDALVSERPYKQAWSMQAAFDLIVEQGGRRFDPRLVELFKSHFPTFAVIWEDLRDAPH